MENGLEILDQDKPIEPSVGSPWEFGMRWGWRVSLLILVWFLFFGNFVKSLDLPEWLMPMALVVVLVNIGYKYEQNQKPIEINFKQMSMAIMAVALCSTLISTSITLLAVMYFNRFDFFTASEGYAFNSSYFVFGFLIPQIGTYIHNFGYAICLEERPLSLLGFCATRIQRRRTKNNDHFKRTKSYIIINHL